MNRVDKLLETKFPEKTETAIRMMKNAIYEVLKEIVIEIGKDVRNANSLLIINRYLEEAGEKDISKKKK